MVWLRFLRAVNGVTTLGDLLASIGADMEPVRPLLGEAITHGILVMTDASA